MTSNSILNINGKSLSRLKIAMSLADDYNDSDIFYSRKPKTIIGFAYKDVKLVFFQYANKDMTPFPAPISLERTAEIAFDWLAVQKYPREPDHDGDNEKGWRLFRDRCGHIEGFGYSAFVAIEPHWLEFGRY